MKNFVEEALFLYEDLFASPKFGRIFKPYPSQLEFIQEFQNLIGTTSGYLDRQDVPGHITASAFIVSKDRKKLLLNHHRKINRWMQFGGHMDGDPHVHNVAMKEAYEETGLTNLSFYSFQKEESPIPFDVDVHIIPPYKNIPQHKHYDIRYLILAENDDFVVSDESIDLKWVPFEEIENYTQETGIVRSLSKIKQLLSVEN